ncbi:carboxylesterase family protein [Panacibacter ginsenosidivorans]|uniref:Carboxylesterase family protein n=1 Tax=Panacibacter ginsenosidivorans TaxID=1813871 RepID=A0A5B8V830_9BACT|nr:GDSL-type esterase/lipase family protein [Panacibacter ginsenosidivorans]QEC66866.1 carboxylesterase family protein [Panacibacter ginsenosidivorans]
MLKRSLPFFFIGLFIFVIAHAQQKVIQLYNGAAPGSESWTWNEAENDSNIWQTKVVYNVSHPTLTVFAPDSMQSTGTAVIICPGGGFHALSINSEGYDVAKWLVKKGVTCFVLKYRLIHCLTNDPAAEFMSKVGKPELETEMKADIPLAVADGRNAIAYVRSHAAEFGIDKNKIGIIGFSAGGTVTASTAFGYTAENKPDFIAPIYPFFPPEMVNNIPADAPPMFITVATDDGFQLTPHSINLYQQWLASKHSAELHIYSTGNHGFGLRVQHLPSDTWIDRFGDWLRLNGYLKMLHQPDWMKKFTDWQLDDMQKENEKRFHNDWQNLGRYRDANTALASTTSTKPRVVFMGNSITDGWINADSSFFAGKNYIDRGISGQTTPQMLIRFRPDVIDLKPAVVVILAGINDIAQNTGPMTLEETFGNIVSMVELAKANKIHPVISSVLPAFDFPWHPGMEPAPKVVKLNAMLKEYAAKNNVVYLDYFSAMKDERNGLPANLSGDGVHPNLAGYKIMEPLAEKAIAEAMKQK